MKATLEWDCGPRAVAELTGRTVSEMRRRARDLGWTPENGMETREILQLLEETSGRSARLQPCWIYLKDIMQFIDGPSIVIVMGQEPAPDDAMHAIPAMPGRPIETGTQYGDASRWPVCLVMALGSVAEAERG